jgi:quinol monooxygenase YgiN
MIHVIATIRTAEGRRNDFLTAFHDLVPQVRAEAGCIEYGPAIDVDTPIASKPVRTDVVMVMEKWESVTALQAHLAAPHMQQFRDRAKDFVQGVEIQVLAPQ